MAVLISQLRPEELAAEMEFAASTGCKLDPAKVDAHVSLVAKDGDKLLAAVLGLCSVGRSCELNVCVGEADGPGSLTGELINKVLMKVHGEGIRRCRINHHGQGGVPSDWPGSKWTGQDEAEAA